MKPSSSKPVEPHSGRGELELPSSSSVPAVRIYDTTLRQEMIDYTTLVYPPPPYDACDPLECPGGRIYHGPVDRVVDKQIALFGEVTYKLTDTLKATVGLRVDEEAESLGIDLAEH